MPVPPEKRLSSVEDYFRREEKALDKHEFHEGEILAMISRFSAQIETFTRLEDGAWRFSAWSGLDAVAKLLTLRIDLPLSEVYSEVTFPARPDVIDEPPR